MRGWTSQRRGQRQDWKGIEPCTRRTSEATSATDDAGSAGTRATAGTQILARRAGLARLARVISSRVCGALLFVSFTATCDEFLIEYSIEASQSYDDNINLSPNSLSASGTIIALPLKFIRRSERTSYELEAEASAHRYDLDAFNSDNQYLAGEVSHALGQGDASLTASFTRDTTRDSEFLDTGVVGPSASRREKANVLGLGSWMLNEKHGVIARLEYSDVAYESLRLNDYEYATSYVGWRFQATEQIQWSLQAGATRFVNDSPVQSLESQGLSTQGGFKASLNERLTLSVQGGWINFDNELESLTSTASSDSDSASSYLLDSSLNYRAERAQWKVALTRRPTPSGFGVLLNTSRLDANYSYRASQRLTLELKAKAGMQESQDPSIGRDRDFINGSARMAYKFDPHWSLAASYVYRWQDSEVFSGQADSNAAFISLQYEPLAKTWSR
ncbi:MAG: hypothetical protein AAF662_01890 [Pseudomonadota bacterium]